MFKSARPVFAAGKEKEMNYQLVLRAFLDSLEGTKLYITAASFYRLTVNGKFAYYGPARAAIGHARVDVVELSSFDNGSGNNEIVIEVVGYFCQSLSTVRQESFVQAEVRNGEDVLVATDINGGFEAYRNCHRVQKADRYSSQRHFCEVWDMREPDRFSDKYKVELSVINNELTYLKTTPTPDSSCFDIDRVASRGIFEFDETLEYRENRYSGNNTPENMIKTGWGAYPNSEVEYRPYPWMGRQRMTMTASASDLPITLNEGEYAIFDLDMIYAGFMRMSVDAHIESDIVLAFSELCTAEKFEFSNINCENVIEYILPEGKADLQSFEPYTAKFMIIAAKKGSFTLSSVGIRKWEFDTSRFFEREFKDPELKAIYDAGVRAFAHNAVDIYMDCPSRERAGWLCDSFFTAKVEYFLTGKCEVEEAFLENYRLFKSQYGILPEGMIPPCYPSDTEREHIPQWAMWYMIETCEYLTERNTNKDIDRESFRESLFGLVGYFEKFENAEGLLERLPNWNFVEWSTANEWTWDVNYPTNFLYAEALERMGKLYGIDALIEKSNAIRAKTAELSFNGEVFIDNAVYGEDGKLHNTENFSEAGQYYAVLFGGKHVDVYNEKYSKLYAHVLSEFKSFDPEMPNFVTVDCMPGYYLKMLTLIRLGKLDILERTIKSFFSVMVELTNTLWEYKPVRRKGSYDHGFASLGAMAAWIVDSSK